MIKKKYFLLLSMLLLTVFLGLFTSSYAYNYRITDADCDTLIDRVVTSSYDWKPTAKTRLKTMVNNVYNNGWDTCVISLNRESYFDIAVYGFNANSVLTVKDSKNVNYMGVTTSNSTNIRYYCSKSGSSMSSISSSTWQNYSTFGSGAQKRSAYLVVPNDLGATGDLFSGPWQSNDYLVFSPPDYFTFLLNANLNNVIINGDSVPYIEHNTNQATTYILGELGLAENFYNAELFTYRWQQGSWKLLNIRTLDYIGPITSNLIEVTIRGDWINPNTLYSLQMNPDPDSDFAPYSQPFFVKNRFTSITNGVLDLDNTFSGDYYNNYNNDTNTEEIINNTNDMSDVDNSLNEFISGDASDIANKFGFVMFSQEYYDFIYNTIVDIVGVLEETGDVYFDYSMHGESPTRIYSSSFTTPNGTLKNFITMFLISCTVFAFYKYIADILELISTGNILEALSEFKVDRNIFKM